MPASQKKKPRGSAAAVGGGAGTTARNLIEYEVTPAAAAATAIVNAKALTAGAQPGLTSGITQPDCARNAVVVGSAVGMTGNVVLYGEDTAGGSINETFALNGTTPVVGLKAFEKVTSYDLPAQGAGGQTVSIGTGSKLGLPALIKWNKVQAAALNNVKEGTPPTVTTHATQIALCTATLNSALNGTVVDILFAD